MTKQFAAPRLGGVCVSACGGSVSEDATRRALADTFTSKVLFQSLSFLTHQINPSERESVAMLSRTVEPVERREENTERS
jgi:hypothetical protein